MTTEQELEKEDKQTCLYDKHVELGALMSPFGGFIMPIQYAGIAPEHIAVREKVGIFDVSHMGEVIVRGRDAERYVQHIFTNDVSDAPIGKIFYGMMCLESLIAIISSSINSTFKSTALISFGKSSKSISV